MIALVPGARPRVALVAHAIHDHGGMERSLAELIRREHHSVDFVVVARDLEPDLRPLIARWLRVAVPARPAPVRFALFYVVAAAQLARLHVDLIHTLGAIVPNRCDVASVRLCHAGAYRAVGALAPLEAAPIRRLNTTFMHAMALLAERWSFRKGRIRRLAPVSESVADEVGRHYSSVPWTVAPNGLDLARFRPNPKARAELRGPEGVDDGEVVVLFVGGLWDHKGLAVAARAMAKAQRLTSVRLHLWVVGVGDAARIRGATTFPRIRFFGFRQDAERYFAAADIFVLPTLYEGCSNVSHEAAASGLPIVATRVGGVTELIGPEEDGGIFVERDADEVARAVARLADDSRLRERMGVQGRCRASTLTWGRATGTVRAIYQELMASGHEHKSPSVPGSDGGQQ